MIKAIFWDNDGILVDTEKFYFESIRQIIFEKTGLKFDETFHIDVNMKQGRSPFEFLLEKGYSQDFLNQLRVERDQRYCEILSANADHLIIPGVEELIKSLSGKYLNAIVTCCRKQHFSIIHSRTNLLKYFDFIVMEGDFVESKPWPDPYLAALKRSGFKPEECIAVEDSPRGIISAQAAGLRAVAIPCGLTIGQDFSGADAVLDKISQIPAFLSSLSC